MSNHDRAAALLHRGVVVGAVAEERLDRRKHSEGVLPLPRIESTVPPIRAITSVLAEAGISLEDLDLIVCGRSLVSCRNDLLEQLPVDSDLVVEPPVPSHHLSHAYASFATSVFDTAAVLILDEQGHRRGEEYESVSWYRGRANGRLEALRTFWAGPDRLSLGMFYNAVATMVGLQEAGRPAAGKLMALAGTANKPPSGELEAIHTELDGGVYASLAALVECLERMGLPVRSGARVHRLGDLSSRFRPIHWSDPIAPTLASWAQHELSRAIEHSAAALARETSERYLCVGGGVALNGPAVTRLGLAWEDVHIHPAATDDGNAIGLAAYGWLEILGGKRTRSPQFSTYLGPSYRPATVDAAVGHFGLDQWSKRGPDGFARAISVLERGGLVCWFEGRSEWGPRALGARSILGLPGPGVTDRVNRRIKHREPFRPVGVTGTPAQVERLGLADRAPRSLLPFMVAVVGVDDASGKGRSWLSAVTHVDGTIRVHALEERRLPVLSRLLEDLGRRNVCDALINTSFNGFGEPLVESPHDAVRQFLLLGTELLYLDGVVIERPPVDELDDTWTIAMEMARAETNLDRSSYAVSLVLKGLADEAERFLASWPDQTGRVGTDSLPPRDRSKLALASAIVLDGGSPADGSPLRPLGEFLAGWADADLARAADIGRRHGRSELAALIRLVPDGLALGSEQQ